jgi:hypothetical protein
VQILDAQGHHVLWTAVDGGGNPLLMTAAIGGAAVQLDTKTVQSATLSSDGSYACWLAGGDVHLADTATGTATDAGPATLFSCGRLADGRVLISAYDHGLWAAAPGGAPAQISSGMITDLRVAPDGSGAFFSAVSGGTAAALWRIVSGQPFAELLSLTPGTPIYRSDGRAVLYGPGGGASIAAAGPAQPGLLQAAGTAGQGPLPLLGSARGALWLPGGGYVGMRMQSPSPNSFQDGLYSGVLPW